MLRLQPSTCIYRRLISLAILASLPYTPVFASGFWNFNFFEGANIESSDHQHSNLKGVSFQGTKMARANFQNANLSHANFKDADMKEGNFQKANLEGANLEHANMSLVNFQGAKMDSTNLQNSTMTYANFKSTLLESANFQGGDVKETNFQEADLTHANLQTADIYQASFKAAKLAFTNFQGSAMELTSMENADIQGANFQGVNMKESNFKNAYIHPAKDGDTSYAPFGCIPASLRAKVQRDQPKSTDPKWQKVSDNVVKMNIDKEACTDFEDASFKDAILYNVNFSNPDHFKNSNLTIAQLCRAQSLYGSIFPQNIMAEIKKDKECARKLTDKALYEQVHNDFLRMQKALSN